jgi:hypothetical protein
MTPPRASLATLLASSSLVLAACGVLPLGGQDPAPVSSRAEADAGTNGEAAPLGRLRRGPRRAQPERPTTWCCSRLA